MTQPTAIGRDSWRLRSVPQHLADRYRAEGWWTDATLGQMVADGLGTHGRRRASGCARRCARGTARSPTSTGPPGRSPPRCGPAASARATSSSSSSRTGSRPASRSGPRPTSGPWSCRSCTSTGPRRSSYIVRATEPDVVVTADRFGHTDHLATWERACWRRHPVPLWLVVGDTATGDLPAARHAVRRRCSTPSPSPRRCAVDPDAPGDRRVHLGHDPRPQGRGALAPHHRLRDPPARPHVPHRRPAADHRRAGGPLHRHAQRLPGAAAARAGRST